MIRLSCQFQISTLTFSLSGVSSFFSSAGLGAVPNSTREPLSEKAFNELLGANRPPGGKALRCLLLQAISDFSVLGSNTKSERLDFGFSAAGFAVLSSASGLAAGSAGGSVR